MWSGRQFFGGKAVIGCRKRLLSASGRLLAGNRKTLRIMAKIYQGILGGFEGRVGPVVGYRLGSKWVVRRLPHQVCNPRTERQVAHRMMFKEIVRLASSLLPVLKVGFRSQAQLWEMTEGNAFVKTNWRREAMPELSELKVSVGAVPMVDFTAVVREGGSLEARWEKNLMVSGAKADDKVHFYAYSESERHCCKLGSAERRAKHAAFLLPEGYEHVWAVVEDRQGRVSNSKYLVDFELPDSESPEDSDITMVGTGETEAKDSIVIIDSRETEAPETVPRE